MKLNGIGGNTCLPPTGCVLFDENRRCKVCKSPYVLNPSTKICWPVGFEYCKEVSKTNGMCGLCVSGYRLYDGRCISGKY